MIHRPLQSPGPLLMRELENRIWLLATSSFLKGETSATNSWVKDKGTITHLLSEATTPLFTDSALETLSKMVPVPIS